MVLQEQGRSFTTSLQTRTDGVYGDLTIMRVKTPWIEALKRQNLEKDGNAAAILPRETQELRPKKMSDSFHKVVRGSKL